MVKARKQNNNIQQRTLTSFITIPSINYGLTKRTLLSKLCLVAAAFSDRAAVIEATKKLRKTWPKNKNWNKAYLDVRCLQFPRYKFRNSKANEDTVFSNILCTCYEIKIYSTKVGLCFLHSDRLLSWRRQTSYQNASSYHYTEAAFFYEPNLNLVDSLGLEFW